MSSISSKSSENLELTVLASVVKTKEHIYKKAVTMKCGVANLKMTVTNDIKVNNN